MTGTGKPEETNATGPPPSTTQQCTGRRYSKIVLTLNNCLLPQHKFVSTPSQLDGLDLDTETDLRILGCELIQTAGILLKLPQVAMATGQVLFQRFYYSKSLVRHSMETTAMGCLCLASKIEEAPRRIRDVINVFQHVRQVRSHLPIQPVLLDQNYINLKNQVIKSERRVLKELGFCVHIKHPHKLIVMYLQVLGLEKQHKLMQLSWNYMNDSLRTDVFLRYQPETVACACIYLTARRLGIALPRIPAWFSVFQVTETDIRDVCYRILALYVRAKPDAEELDRKLEELRHRYQEARLKSRENPVILSGNSPVSQTVPELKMDDAATSPLPHKHRKRNRRSKSASRSPKKARRKDGREKSRHGEAYDRYQGSKVHGRHKSRGSKESRKERR